MRHPSIYICMIALSLTACSDKAKLTLEDKAKYTAELIDKRSQCAVFAQRLSLPVASGKVIDETYKAAQAAFCVKPDV